MFCSVAQPSTASRQVTPGFVWFHSLSDFLFTVARVAAAADGVDEEVYERPQTGKTTDQDK